MKKRIEIAEKYKWDFSDYFKDDSVWYSSYEDYKKEIKKISYFNGKLKDKKNILSCFKLLEEVSCKLDALYMYANCNSNVNVADTNYQVMLNKIDASATEQSVVCSFIEPQLCALDENFLKSLLQDSDFADYSKLLKDVLKEKSHILSEDCEKLLSSVSSFSSNFSQNHSNFEDGDLKFNKVKNKLGKELPMSNSLASIYLRSADDVLRENSYKELQGAYGRYNNFLTSNYLGSVKKDIFYSRARKFNSALEKALFYEEVSKSVYDNLIKNVENNLALNHKYFEIKRKLVGLKKFRLCDIYYNPFVSSKKYTYEQALDTVCSALSMLGSDYTDYIKKMAHERMIDVYPNENKTSGAYETMASKKTPRVLTNFVGTFNDVSTLAHELGHAMHSVYSSRAQSVYNAGYTIFLAEIASTVNETILNNYMLDKATTDKEKIFYLNEFLSNYYATVFRQTMFANFEEQIYSKAENNEELSNKVLNETYFSLVKKYFGKKIALEKEVQYEWSRIPHFYNAFYVYKYATGIISAINIVENLRLKKITVEDYKKFLSSGCTNTPTELLKIVNVNFDSEEPFKVAFEYVNKKLNLLSSLEKKIK